MGSWQLSVTSFMIFFCGALRFSVMRSFGLMISAGGWQAKVDKDCKLIRHNGLNTI